MNITRYIETDVGFVAFAVTAGVSTILASLAIISYVGPVLNVGFASQIRPAIEELGMMCAGLLTVFVVLLEVVNVI
jgi:hypothetical protein